MMDDYTRITAGLDEARRQMALAHEINLFDEAQRQIDLSDQMRGYDKVRRQISDSAAGGRFADFQKQIADSDVVNRFADLHKQVVASGALDHIADIQRKFADSGAVDRFADLQKQIADSDVVNRFADLHKQVVASGALDHIADIQRKFADSGAVDRFADLQKQIANSDVVSRFADIQKQINDADRVFGNLNQLVVEDHARWDEIATSINRLDEDEIEPSIMPIIPSMADRLERVFGEREERDREIQEQQFQLLRSIADAGKKQNETMAQIVKFQGLLVEESLENTRIQKVVLLIAAISAALTLAVVLFK